MALYLSNSAVHSASVRGGKIPVTGFHSVIESPDSVSRVAPPTTTSRRTRNATVHSQVRMERDASMKGKVFVSSPVCTGSLATKPNRLLIGIGLTSEV